MKSDVTDVLTRQALASLCAAALLLVAAPAADAQGLTTVSPEPNAAIQARGPAITFTVTGPPDRTCPGADAGSICAFVSNSPQQDSDGRIDPDAAFASLKESASNPGTYSGSSISPVLFPLEPGIYYWQASYFAGGCSPDCYAESPVRTLSITPVAPPRPISPSPGVTVPFGGAVTLAAEEPFFENDDASALYIEIARGSRLDPDGTFADADSWLMVSPSSAGGRLYEYRFDLPFTEVPGKYYWQTLRYDCFAEPDCYVAGNEIRSFEVFQKPAPGGGENPDPCLAARVKLKHAARALRRAARAVRRADTRAGVRRARSLLTRAKRRVRKARRAVEACG